MGRTLSTDLSNLLTLPERRIDYTLLLTFPDASVKRFATAPLTLTGVPAGTYTNDIESVGEIRYTLEAPADRFSIALQNKDRVLSIDLATNWQKWRTAEALIGRYYRDPDDVLPAAWIEMFSGSVQQPNSNDLQVTFDVIDDTLTPGEIVCTRTLGLLCPFIFKDPKTCGYVGSETVCNHHLKSPGGCEGRNNSHRFGGMEHRYIPDAVVPGIGGNEGGDIGPPEPPCPRIDQYVIARGVHGERIAKMAGFVTEDDWLWNPIAKKFYRVSVARLEKDQPVFRIACDNGAAGHSAVMHRILWYREHENGERVDKFLPGDPVLGYSIRGRRLKNLRCTEARAAGRGDLIRISLDAPTEAEKVYCYGDSVEEFIVCHNLKWGGDGFFPLGGLQV